ncbi:ABC transporter permease [Microvirga massiliensis]|uniref:ABC transporter permease n=1 Tax=Microvirga massiliensis TaxID=1033741 RepID=UPI00062BC6A3|nr:ABC transporter permease [Microvirga massiliensis]
MLRLAPGVTLALFLTPLLTGLAGTVLPAFGYFPPLGHHDVSLQPWRDLFGTPGVMHSIALTILVGLGATMVSLACAIGLVALMVRKPVWVRLEAAISPLLATPHVAIAIGFAFLIAPSGWIARLISPELTGWTRPPDLLLLRDPYGLSFLAGLALKEIPYLVLMIVASSRQVPVAALISTGRSLGYSFAASWILLVLPLLYRQIRLPVYAVLAFTLSVVEVGLILAPSQPPPLPVLATRWFLDQSLDRYLPACAAAVLQLVIVVLSIIAWRAGEAAAGRLVRRRCETGHRRSSAAAFLLAASSIGTLSIIVSLWSLAVLGVWSVARTWTFPEDLPESWTLAIWTGRADMLALAGRTAFIALCATLIAMALSIACLENERRRGITPRAGILWLLYFPLLVPQVAFLFGAQIAILRLGWDATLAAVIWSHLLFVLPYVFLSLADPYRALNPRFAQIAASLGATPAARLRRVVLPILLKPILVAFAIGFSVSVALYLPTLFAGAGRVATLTTEAVTLSAGVDRRIVSAVSLLQALLPLVVYGLAIVVPLTAFRNRRLLR